MAINWSGGSDCSLSKEETPWNRFCLPLMEMIFEDVRQMRVDDSFQEIKAE